VYAQLKKQPAERKIKVTLKNQNMFDTEGHASVPLLPPEQLPKRHAYRQVYAEQLGAWGLFIQAAEILKFNGLINYWKSDSRTFSLQSQMEKIDQPAPASKPLDVVFGQAPQPPSRSRSPFGPLVPPHKMVRANSSVSHVEAFRDRSGPPSRAMSEIGPSIDPGQWSDYTLPRAQLDLDGINSSPRSRRSTKAVNGGNCYICLERIQGLSVSCPRGEHNVHAQCYTEYLSGTTEEDTLFRDVSCGCKLPAIEEEQANGSEHDWPAIVANGASKH
jgi:hypothetical protein